MNIVSIFMAGPQTAANDVKNTKQNKNPTASSVEEHQATSNPNNLQTVMKSPTASLC